MIRAPEPCVARVFASDIAEFQRRLQRAGQTVPLYVTSWYRDPAANRAVGGKEHSQHLIGTAADLREVPGLREALAGAGLRVVVESDHVHAQLHPAGYLGSLLAASRELRDLVLGVR